MKKYWTIGIVAALLIAVAWYGIMYLRPVVVKEESLEHLNAPMTVLVTASTTALGTYLTDRRGRAVYRFANDENGISNCTAQCAQTWPPALVRDLNISAGEGIPGPIGIVQRPDGAMQLSYQGHPLYYYTGDVGSGTTNGHGRNNLWFVVAP